MAAPSSFDEIKETTGLQFERLKGRLFEILLICSTLVGILSLLVLFVYITVDALGLLAASPTWYLIYFATLVAPTAAFTLYARRNPAAGTANAKSFAAVFGGLVIGLVVYALFDALNPYDVLIYFVFGAVPPLAVAVYGRRFGNETRTGPAIPVSILAGIAVAAVAYGPLRPIVGIAARWIAFLILVTLPVAALGGVLATRRWSLQRGLLVAGLVLGGALATVGGSLGAGIDPSLGVVMFSLLVVPTGYVIGETVATESRGRIGLLGPFVIIGGTLLGAFIERQLGVSGLEGYLSPTLLLNSWDGLTASNAGVYPQIVGSIIIVGFMSLMTFPIGVGAAVYLEEYAPETGLRGRLATLLEVNISNLAGVPSVVYGLLGLALFRNALGFGPGLVVAAAGTLGLLILPIVVVSAQEALRSVPESLRQASYGMGASRWQTLREVVFPEAVPGILTGTILALGRAIGETAPLVIIGVATTTYSPPDGVFAGATALPLQIFAAAGNAKPEYRTGVVAAAAIVLLG
ncbi:MAG: phosphate transport system permease protein, partial [Natronomonas sp.]